MGLFRSPPAAPPPRRASSLAAYCAAQGVSSVGDWMQRAGMGWLAWDLTHSPGWVGALALTEVVMPLWITPMAGALADRLSPFRILLVSQTLMTLQAVALAVYVLSGGANIYGLYVLALAGSGFSAMNAPVRLTVINLITPEGRLSQAIATNSLLFNLARVVGPAGAGAIMITGHVFPVFALNALTYLAMIAAVLYLRPWIDRAARPKTGGLGADVADGMRYIVRTPQIATLFALTAGFAIFARPFAELWPAVAGQIFAAGPQGLSGLMTAQGVGALFGAGMMLGRHGVRRLLVLTFGSAFIMAFAVIGLSLTPTLTLAFGVAAVAGLGHTACNIGMQSLAQMMADETYRGRVMSLYGLLFRSAPSGSAFLIGLLAEQWSLRLLLGASAAVAVLLIGLVAMRARRVYRAGIEPA